MKDLQLLFRPRSDLNQSARVTTVPAAEAAVARWEELFGATERCFDVEDWHESAARLFAAIDSGLPTYVVERSRDSVPQTLRAFNASAPFDPETPFILLGVFTNNDPLLKLPGLVSPLASEVGAAHRYHLNQAFHRHAARATATGGIGLEESVAGRDLVDAVAEIARAGHTRQRIKIMSSAKYAHPCALEIADPEDRGAIRDALFQAFDYTLIHLDGLPDAFLVQEEVEMGNEYRVVVIGGRPVAGAGCVEDLSPPHALGPAFDPQMERRRNDGAIVVDEALAARYAAEAERIAADLAAENPNMMDYTLDLFTRPDGTIGMLEANPILNYGLYAMTWAPVLEAMIARARAGLRDAA